MFNIDAEMSVLSLPMLASFEDYRGQLSGREAQEGGYPPPPGVGVGPSPHRAAVDAVLWTLCCGLLWTPRAAVVGGVRRGQTQECDKLLCVPQLIRRSHHAGGSRPRPAVLEGSVADSPLPSSLPHSHLPHTRPTRRRVRT